jgi:hypothetical protein
MSDDEPEAESIRMDSGPNKEGMVDNYLPAGEEWAAKTLLEENDAAAIAVLRQYGGMYPEVDDLQPIIDQFLFEFLRARTSIGGKSRNEYQRIFESMFGGHPDEQDNFKDAFVSAFGADEDD